MQETYRPGRHHRRRRAGRPVALMLALALVLGLAQQVAFAPKALAAACTGGILNVLAHQDDDLLFQSPDLLNDISAGRCVRSLYLTAGDGGYFDDYWQSREEGIENAYATMAGVSNSWSTSTLSAAGKTLRLRTLNGANISLAFMRLPDGFPLGVGSAEQGFQSVKRLLDGAIGTITAVDGSNSYSSSTLRNTVLDVIRLSNATTVRTQDYVHSYGYSGGGYMDHYDHHSISYVARDASNSYGASRLVGYMGYPVSGQGVNVSGSLLTRKTQAFEAYAEYDDEVTMSEYVTRGWINRQYTVGSSGAAVVAFAGADQTANAGAQVTLDASGSTASGSMSYAWTQTSGPTVSLSSTTAMRPTFVPTSAGAHTFQVRVTSGSSSATDTVVVTVNSTTAGNVARLAGVTVTASSQTADQPAARVVDGSADGWPTDYTKEWSTAGGGVGSWVKLTWAAPVFVDRVILYDRPNLNDQVQGGVLRFSDGTTVTVGALNNAGGGTTVAFAPRATSSIQFDITAIASTGENIGLAEFEVVGALDKAPTANAGVDLTGTTGTQVALNGTGTDPDAGTTLKYAWTQTSGPSATLSSTTVAKPTFMPTAAGTYVFSLTVSDGALTSPADTVTVTITGTTNTAPTANAGADQSVATNTLVTLNGSGTDPEGTTLTYLWSKTSGPAATLSSTTVAKPTFTPTVAGTYVFSLVVRDGALNSVADTVTITVTAPNAAPTANAGADQSVATNTLVTLNGTGTDPEGTALTYLWSKTAGPAATLSSTTVAKPTFTPTVAGTYVFALTVNDGSLTSAADSVTITVTAPNQAPTALAGADQSVATNTLVTLNGSGTDPEGATLTYLWSKTSGPAATLSSTTVAKPTFTPTVAGTYVFSLVVRDGALNSVPDTVSIVVTTTPPPNTAPTANAGADQSVATNALVTLDGSASSDPEGATLTYLWSKTSGPAATLSSTTVAKPTFTPTVAGTYVFSLVVRDGALNSVPDTVSIVVTTTPPPNQAPTALAGADQSVAPNTLVTLNGSGTDPEGATLTYLWSRTSGPAATLSSTTVAKPTFTPTVAGAYVFALTVNDGSLTSAADSVTITVTAPNQAPTALAGADQSVATNTLVTLNGSGTDPEGATLTYLWSKTSGPAATLSSTTVAKPTFTPTVAGTYVFSLVVRDGALNSVADTVTITVTAATAQAPTANAGADLSAAPGATITLDGSGSTNPNAGTTLGYAWRQTAGPAATLSSTTASKPTFVANTAGTYVFELTVTAASLSDTDTVNVVVTAPQSVNLARVAGVSVTASSQNTSTTQTAAKAVDGSAVGYPTDYTKEWATTGGTAGSWLQLTWASPVTLSRVVLYDRPNTNDQVTGGTLLFSDGTSVPVTALTNSGSATTFNFAAKTVTSVRLQISSVGAATENVGLAEFEAWGYSGGSVVNQAPVARAGADLTGTTGTAVTLDGSASSDPDAGTTLTYSWARTSGPAATLSGATSARPTFTPGTAGTYEFTLTVSDGVLSSSDVVAVVVAQAPNRAPIANAGANQAVALNTLTTLNGSASSDPEGGTLTYAWVRKSGPAAVTLAGATTARPTFTPAVAGAYVFTLTVRDTGGLTASADVTVTASAVAPTLVNLARVAGVSVTASSQDTSTTQTAAKAVDGSAVGYPTDYTKEWATVGGGAGSWLQLTWASPVTLSRVVLYDRPNTNDQVTGGTLVFSDGTSVPVTALTNSGSATTFNFAAKTVTSVRLQVSSVAAATENVGLAELEAWGYVAP